MNDETKIEVLDDVFMERKPSKFSFIAICTIVLFMVIEALYIYLMSPKYIKVSSMLPDQVDWLPSVYHKIPLWILLGVSFTCTVISYYRNEKYTWYKVTVGILNSFIGLILIIMTVLVMIGVYE